MIIFQPWEPETLIIMKQVTERKELFPILLGEAPRPRESSELPNAQPMGQPGGCTEGWGFTEEPSYPPKGWSCHLKKCQPGLFLSISYKSQFLHVVCPKGRLWIPWAS